MTSSLPKFGRLDPALVGPEARAALRVSPSLGDLDLGSAAVAMAPEPPPRRRLKDTPTRQSIEAVRLAEEETRIATLVAGMAEEVSQARRLVDIESGTFEAGSAADQDDSSPFGGASSPAVDELYTNEMDRALALGAELVAELGAGDPYGGLIPVEDVDPFGGLEPVYDDDDDDFDNGEFDDDSVVASTSATAEVSRISVLPGRRVPRVLVDAKEISKLPMDPRAAFILGHIDGFHSLEEILDMCPMPESEALELVDRLHRMGVISLR